jgi:transformation/transcription domain-associated protein
LLQHPLQQQAHEEAQLNGTVFIGKSPLISQHALYSDLKALQVKTVSFIAYVLRSFIEVLNPYQETIATGVILLMKDCPPDASGTRKELLVATRHLWYTPFRNAFIPYIDVLLNDNVLIGTGITCRETLRPVAHSVLVDLIHNVKGQLSASQIMKIIYIYSRNMHDPKFPIQVQTMCAKLLLSMIENIMQKTHALEGSII